MAHESTPPLEYEDQPVVGSVVCQRAGGVLTIRVRRSTAALLQAALVGGAGLTLMAVVVVAIFSGGLSTFVLWGLLGVGGFLVAGATLAARGFSPVVIALDDEKLTLRARGLLEIQTGEIPRDMIADLRIDRLPFKDTLLRPHAVNVVLYDGGQVQLFIASRLEARYVADVLREALHLLPERWPEVGYPPQPWTSRVTRKIDPLGMTLRLRPSLIPAWFAATVPFLAAASLFIAARVLDRTDPSRWNGWFLLWTAAYFVMMCIALLAVGYKLRTRYTLMIDAKTLMLREIGLRPGEAEWDVTEIVNVGASARRRWWWGHDLEALFQDGTRSVLFPRLPRRDVSWVSASVRQALRREIAQQQASFTLKPTAPAMNAVQSECGRRDGRTMSAITTTIPGPSAADLTLGERLSLMQGRTLTPSDVAKPLIAAGLKFVLVGGHAINAWTGEPRATIDIDIIAERPAKARDVLRAAFPQLSVEEHPVVIRFKDAAMEAIDIIRPDSSPLFKRVLKLTHTVKLGGLEVLIPQQEAALALKFAALVMPTRRLEDRYIDARDFILVAKSLAAPDETKLAELGELAFTGGGNELLKLVADARAGRRLEF